MRPAPPRGPFPAFGVTVSALGHALIVAAALLLAQVWNQWNPSKVYIVNLVPTVSAVDSPVSQSAPPTVAPRPITPEVPQKTPPPELPRRAPEPPVEIPRKPVPPITREAPALPKLPDPSLPPPTASSRPAALPRAGEKELPALAASSDRRPVTQLPPLRPQAAPPRTESANPVSEPRPAVAPIPLGGPTGSPTGVASLALDVADFPFTYYLRQIQQKVSENWVPPARPTEPSQRAVVLFEISRDGRVRTSKVEKSSGNAFYDQSALRAVTDSAPFPPLPQDFPAPSLRVHFGFDLTRDPS